MDGTIICCGRGRVCSFCGEPSTKLCDAPIKVGDVGHKRTCDARMCDACATRVGANTDVCPNHKEAPVE
jgi:hypothetical protein